MYVEKEERLINKEIKTKIGRQRDGERDANSGAFCYQASEVSHRLGSVKIENQRQKWRT